MLSWPARPGCCQKACSLGYTGASIHRIDVMLDDAGEQEGVASAARVDQWLTLRSSTCPSVAQRCWEAAVLARKAGAPVKEVLECLWVDGADQERARLALKRLPSAREPSDLPGFEEALSQLAQLRVYEVLRPLWDQYYATVFELQSTVDELDRQEGAASAVIAELATILRRLQELDRVSLGARSKLVLLKRAEQVCEQLDAHLNHLLVVLDRISELIARLTFYTDAGLLQSGYTVPEILELGAAPRSARSVYRRQGLAARKRPSTRIDREFVEAFAGAATRLTPGVALYNDWTQRILAELTALEKCRVDLPAAIASGDLVQVTRSILATGRAGPQ